MKSHYWKFGLGMGFFFIAVVMVTGLAVMVLWNHLMPAIFGLPEIFFGQAIGLLVLARILTGGFGKWGGRRGAWKHQWRERWQNMSPEQREQMKQKYFSYCSFRGKSSKVEAGSEPVKE